MPIDYAAHVGCPITHSSDTASFGLSVAGIVIATVVVVLSEGTALLAFGAAMEAAGTVATAGSVGMIGGKQVDKLLPESEAEGVIATGLTSVLLGPSIKPAARAVSEDTKTKKCHVEMMGEGSETVMLGVDSKPFSRRGDRVGPKCGGKVFDGIHSIEVGGERSAKGKEWEEQDSLRVTLLSKFLDVVGGVSLGSKGGVANVLRGAGQATSVVMPDDTGKIVKSISTPFPKTTLEAIDATNTHKEGLSALGKVLGGGGGGEH